MATPTMGIDFDAINQRIDRCIDYYRGNPTLTLSKSQLKTLATAAIERLGQDSPARVIASDTHLLQYIGEFTSCELFEAIANRDVSAVNKIPLSEKNLYSSKQEFAGINAIALALRCWRQSDKEGNEEHKRDYEDIILKLCSQVAKDEIQCFGVPLPTYAQLSAGSRLTLVEGMFRFTPDNAMRNILVSDPQDRDSHYYLRFNGNKLVANPAEVMTQIVTEVKRRYEKDANPKPLPEEEAALTFEGNMIAPDSRPAAIVDALLNYFDTFGVVFRQKQTIPQPECSTAVASTSAAAAAAPIQVKPSEQPEEIGPASNDKALCEKIWQEKLPKNISDENLLIPAKAVLADYTSFSLFQWRHHGSDVGKILHDKSITTFTELMGRLETLLQETVRNKNGTLANRIGFLAIKHAEMVSSLQQQHEPVASTSQAQPVPGTR
jgi:hypothetical protein